MALHLGVKVVGLHRGPMLFLNGSAQPGVAHSARTQRALWQPETQPVPADSNAPASWSAAQRKSALQALDIFRTRLELRFAQWNRGLDVSPACDAGRNL